jgi:hypothetical protein
VTPLCHERETGTGNGEKRGIPQTPKTRLAARLVFTPHPRLDVCCALAWVWNQRVFRNTTRRAQGGSKRGLKFEHCVAKRRTCYLMPSEEKEAPYRPTALGGRLTSKVPVGKKRRGGARRSGIPRLSPTDMENPKCE